MKPLSLARPHLIIMVGIPGAGKSFFAEHFATTFNAPLISYGRIRHDLYTQPDFSLEETIAVSRVAEYMLDELFKTNQTIIFDGATELHKVRLALTQRANKADYIPLLVWVQTESATSRLRATKHSREHPGLTGAQFDTQLKRFALPIPAEKPIVISGKHTYASQLKIVLSHLAAARETTVVAQARGVHSIPIR